MYSFTTWSDFSRVLQKACNNYNNDQNHQNHGDNIHNVKELWIANFLHLMAIEW
jgi:hypothetical protein